MPDPQLLVNGHQLSIVVQPPIESHFLVNYVGERGWRDEDWTLKLQPPESWIVISCDAGRTGPRTHAKGAPLHLILPQRKITGFFLRGKRFNHVTGQERAAGIISAMEDILKMAQSANAGQRFVVNRSGNKCAIRTWDLH